MALSLKIETYNNNKSLQTLTCYSHLGQQLLPEIIEITAMAPELKTAICNKMVAFQTQHKAGITLMSLQSEKFHTLILFVFLVIFKNLIRSCTE